MTFYRNILSPPAWSEEGVIWTIAWDRKNIRIADIDGDGKCDVILLSPNKELGTATWYKNNYNERTGNFGWAIQSTFGLGIKCQFDNGVGQYDIAVTFADIK